MMQRFSTQRATVTVLLCCAVLLYLRVKNGHGGLPWHSEPQTVFKVNENSPLLKDIQNSTLGVCTPVTHGGISNNRGSCTV